MAASWPLLCLAVCLALFSASVAGKKALSSHPASLLAAHTVGSDSRLQAVRPHRMASTLSVASLLHTSGVIG